MSCLPGGAAVAARCRERRTVVSGTDESTKRTPAAHATLRRLLDWRLSALPVLAKAPHARERDPQLRIRPRPNLVSNDFSLRERGTRSIGKAGKFLRFGAVAELHAKAHPVLHCAQ